jgi:hypothetical protein
MCKSEHVKGVAAGMKVYNPGDRKACGACQTSRVAVKKTTANRKKDLIATTPDIQSSPRSASRL